jgi:carbon-monoxide dehydrogenase medium subunit
VYPNKIEYYRPGSVQEAVQLLGQNEGAKIIAGGHSLLPLMKLRLLEPPALIDIGRVADLTGVQLNDGLTVGAMTTYRELLDTPGVADRYAALTEASSKVGDIQVRNRGTVGGAVAHADPASDLPAVMLALEATIHATGPNGERSIAATDFFVDVLTTALDEHEILTKITIPALPARTGSAYAKFSHPASGYAIVGVAAVVTLDGSGNIGQARVAVTGAGPKAVRLTGVEQALAGKAAGQIADACKNASEGLELSGDIHASEEYRAHLVNVFTRRAVEAAAERARG